MKIPGRIWKHFELVKFRAGFVNLGFEGARVHPLLLPFFFNDFREIFFVHDNSGFKTRSGASLTHRLESNFDWDYKSLK
jgi:hypothetical protein